MMVLKYDKILKELERFRKVTQGLWGTIDIWKELCSTFENVDKRDSLNLM